MKMRKQLSSSFFNHVSLPLFRKLEPQLQADVLQILTEGMISTIEVGDFDIKLYAPFPGLKYRADNYLNKEVDTLRWIDGFNDNEVFWDIGANVGTYSLYAALRRQARVLAFEPVFGNCYALSRNIIINGLDDKVQTCCVALAGESRLGVINLSSLVMGSAAHQFGNSGENSPFVSPQQRQATQGAISFSADDFVKYFHPPIPNHIKMDVDGIELQIIRGAKSVLKAPQLQSVMIELRVTFQKEVVQATSLLREAGFDLVARGDEQGSGPEKGANHLFRRQ